MRLKSKDKRSTLVGMKSDRSKMWFVRITAPWEHIESKYLLVREWIDHVSSAIGFHHGTKTGKAHAHIAITLRSELQKQSLDTRFKKLFDVKGSDYSSKVWDGSKKVLSYLYHDKAGKVDVNMPLSDEEIKEIESLRVVYEDIVTTAKAKASYKCVDVVLEAIKESGRLWSVREIIVYILQGVRDGKWHPPGPMMDRYIDEIRLKQGDDKDALHTIQIMASSILARYER